ncbi:hypothetical protein Tco_1005709 [Tanacetum coccineum]|uniref:Uncharacterized protein n=1 Tax=Tanacetum coccineum TaxID=301880 RepID=A0ABQ5FG31_9ASTR
MTSFDYRLNPIYAIKECSTCGVLYTADFCCSKKGLEDKILVPKPPRNCARCARCGTPVDGPYCQGCALLRKEFMEGLFTNCVENEFFKDFQDTSESSDDNTNVVNAPREPIVVNQDPGENSSPSPLHIDHCCHECGDSLDGIFCRQCTFIQKKEEEKRIAEEQAAKDRYWKIPICYDDDEDNTIAINNTVLPPRSRLTLLNDILREKLLNVNLLILRWAMALRDNPTPSSEVVIKSTSTFPNLFLEETNTFDNSIPESETFRFNLEEISSGSPTTHSDYSLPDYEAFYSDDDHIKEKNSGSTTTHADFSQYDSFIFDLSINPFPPADRSDLNHEEFADELAHIISPPEYDHFCFKIEPELGNLTMDVVKDIFNKRTKSSCA